MAKPLTQKQKSDKRKAEVRHGIRTGKIKPGHSIPGPRGGTKRRGL